MMTLLAALLLAGTLSTPDAIPGKYVCTGVDSTQKSYTIRLVVSAYEGSYRLQWLDRDGTESARGIGVKQGRVLSVALSNGRSIAVAGYTIGPDTLDGRWWPGLSDPLPERCEKAPSQAAE